MLFDEKYSSVTLDGCIQDYLWIFFLKAQFNTYFELVVGIFMALVGTKVGIKK